MYSSVTVNRTGTTATNKCVPANKTNGNSNSLNVLPDNY